MYSGHRLYLPLENIGLKIVLKRPKHVAILECWWFCAVVVLRLNKPIYFAAIAFLVFVGMKRLFGNPSLREKLIKYVTVISTVERCLIFCVYLQTHSLRSLITTEASAAHLAYATQVYLWKSYDSKPPDTETLTARRWLYITSRIKPDTHDHISDVHVSSKSLALRNFSV